MSDTVLPYGVRAFGNNVIPFPARMVTSDISTNGSKGQLKVAHNRLYYPDSREDGELLGGDEFEVARMLAEQPNVPFMTHELQQDLEHRVNGFKTKSAFRGLILSIVGPTKEHFVSFGRGKGTWYGFISNNKDVEPLCAAAIDIVCSGSNTERNLKKRLEIIDSFQFYFENPEELEKAKRKKKIIGASVAATTVTIAAVAATVAVKTHKA